MDGVTAMYWRALLILIRKETKPAPPAASLGCLPRRFEPETDTVRSEFDHSSCLAGLKAALGTAGLVSFLIRLLIGLSSWFLLTAHSVAVAEVFGMALDSGLVRSWRPQGQSSSPVLINDAGTGPVVRFSAPFSRVTDWRLNWDLDVKADLSEEKQIVLRLRTSDPRAVAVAVVLFRSGEGWYRFPGFSVGKDWTVTVLNKAQAVSEGAPSGWNSVDRVRISFLPGEKRDTDIDLAGLSTRMGWPLEQLGALGGYVDLKHSAAGLRAAAKGLPQDADVESRLKRAEALEGQAATALDAQERQMLIGSGRATVAEAYALVQAPKVGEFRGLWLHNGEGVRGPGRDRAKRWRDALPEIKAQGYNAVMPNVLFAGVAFYRSKLVLNHAGVAREGDYLKEILDAARPLGIKVHPWKVMWQLGEGWTAPAGVSEPFRRAGRLQVDARGKELPWLCPCDERNRRYELDAIKELARDYAIDGIHLDYIRWDGDKGSFTPMCQERFEKWSGAKVVNWPQDVLTPGSRQAQWQEFKRDVITSFVRETRQALKGIKPELQLSAAVFPNPGQARNSVFQDWPLWVKEGLVDWVSTMTYDEDAASFKASLQQQKAVMVNSAVKLYPGIRFTYEGGRTLALDSAVDEIKAVRDLGLEGFSVFEWRDHLRDSISPYLRAGLLRDGPYLPVVRYQRKASANTNTQPASLATSR